MGLQEVNGVNGKNSVDYLDVSNLVEGMVYEKVALVVSADASTTRQNTGFARFYLKDVNSNVICARLFDVKDFAFCGVKLTNFKNKPVKLKFAVQEFNGSLSLVVDGSAGIQVYDGEFDYSRFVGKLEYDDSLIISTGRTIFGEDWDINPEWRFTTIDSIGQGRIGGFMKVFEQSLGSLLLYQGIDGIVLRDLMKAYYVAMSALFQDRRNQSLSGVLDSTKTFDNLMALNNEWYSDELHGIIMDAVKSVVGLTKPTHLYSHLICSAVNTSIDNINLALVNNGMILGMKSWVGGVLLSKF